MNTTDLALFSDVQTLDPESFGPFGVRGPDKVAQRFLYALQTPPGSVPGRPSDGSQFLSLLGDFASEFDVYIAFAAAEPAAAATAQSYEDADDVAGERFGYARLSSVEISGDGVVLTITIASADGTLPAVTTDVTFEA